LDFSSTALRSEKPHMRPTKKYFLPDIGSLQSLKTMICRDTEQNKRML
jgi:hypothetical protein